MLSIVGLGGMVFVGMDQDRASRLVEEALEQGVNYFDAAPSYGEGVAEERLSAALQPHRSRVFLSGKTLARTAKAARLDLENSLRRLRSRHFDLYQLHAINRMNEVEEVCAPEGALEGLQRAREEGLIRFLGFSSHSVPAALALLDRFHFDAVLFPVNFVCYARGNFGPQVLERARDRGVACLALKALAFTPWRKGESRPYANCWYRPIDDPELALLALRFSLSEDVVSALPPGDESLARLAIRLAFRFAPLTPEERCRLMDGARGCKPIMTAPRLTPDARRTTRDA